MCHCVVLAGRGSLSSDLSIEMSLLNESTLDSSLQEDEEEDELELPSFMKDRGEDRTPTHWGSQKGWILRMGLLVCDRLIGSISAAADLNTASCFSFL